jgi:protein-tyrosine kinase
MSRFYKALKEAGQFSDSPMQESNDHLERTIADAVLPEASASSPALEAPPAQPRRVPRLPDLTHLLLPPEPPYPHPPEAVPQGLGRNAIDGLSEPSSRMPLQEPLLPVPPVAEQELGAHAKVALDPKARLLPQTLDASVVEQYRRLRTKILQEQSVKAFRTLMIASGNPQEGKTVTTLNLGFSFALLPAFKVLVVDGDLRKGSLGKWLGLEDRPGLANLIDGSAALEDVVFKSDDIALHFMVRGKSRAAPGELLQASNLSGHLRRMGQYFDLVLVDSPPLNLMTDAQLLATSCDAVLLLARAFSTRSRSLEKAVHDLQACRIIGTVLNGGIQARPHGYYYGYGGAQQ